MVQRLAKFIVRFDYKNYENDQNKLPITRSKIQKMAMNKLELFEKRLKRPRLVADKRFSYYQNGKLKQSNPWFHVEAIPAT